MESKVRHDSLVSSVSTSETDILSDMIPYRCPKCGNKRRFAALRDLKLHLDVEHSFKMGCVKPRSRNDVFNHKLTKEKPLVTSGKYVKTKHGGKFSPRSSTSEGSYGSMLKYYDDEAKILEMKVKKAKETEIKNKLNRNILPKSGGENLNKMGMPNGDDLKQSFNNVNNQLLKSRHKEWQASEALYQAEDIILGVEEAAENRCLDQQVVIRDLVNDLRQKEGQLNRANNDLDKVRRERESLMLEVEELFSEANTGNTVLREELGRREHMLGDVNRQLDTLRARARIDLDRKEDELIAAEGRVEALEKERERLVQGTNTLLEQADKDRAVLKETVQTKEKHLHQVNRELDKLKSEQSDLVQESVDLYEKANEGTARLKHLVQAKDNQLQEAFHELESMKNVHEKLIWQSKTLTEQADSNNQALTELLQSKEEELERAKQTLSKVKENNMAAFKTVLADKEAELIQAKNELANAKAEKTAMMESVKDLTQKASDQDVKMTELHNQVQERERKLQEKERDLDSLKTFLSSAAEKEVAARSKLEQFISGLIDRADKAESELHKIKTRSMSEVDLSRSHTLGDVSDVMESDQEDQRLSHNRQKVRAKSQDSNLKSANFSKVHMNSGLDDVSTG
ncbi:paramyosin-like [Pecten maximus]|uniref:paramyosin-like n=1 Tax=Pecten maximus TaxID=6579 RepID=UPI001458D503|nr:paramyosin-like [Pecten maximus]